MRCTNAGADYDPEDVQWTCQASLPTEFKLGSTEVVCEGYESPEDPFVLKGSCGVEYRLILTEEGERRFGERVDDGGYEDDGYGYGGGSGYGAGKKGKGGMGEMLFTVVFWAIFLGERSIFSFTCLCSTVKLTRSTGIIGLIAKSIWTGGGGGNNAVGRRPGNGWGGGYGGGGGGDEDGHDDSPPPYSPYSKQNSRSAPSSSSWRPGLFSGAAAGAAAGYALGSRNNNSNRGPSTGQAGPSNWFGNSNSNSGAGPSRSSFGGGGGGSSASPPSSSGGARYESTGFGGSRRR
jgi:hypothetical protein